MECTCYTDLLNLDHHTNDARIICSKLRKITRLVSGHLIHQSAVASSHHHCNHYHDTTAAPAPTTSNSSSSSGNNNSRIGPNLSKRIIEIVHECQMAAAKLRSNITKHNCHHLKTLANDLNAILAADHDHDDHDDHGHHHDDNTGIRSSSMKNTPKAVNALDNDDKAPRNEQQELSDHLIYDDDDDDEHDGGGGGGGKSEEDNRNQAINDTTKAIDNHLFSDHHHIERGTQNYYYCTLLPPLSITSPPMLRSSSSSSQNNNNNNSSQSSSQRSLSSESDDHGCGGGGVGGLVEESNNNYNYNSCGSSCKSGNRHQLDDVYKRLHYKKAAVFNAENSAASTAGAGIALTGATKQPTKPRFNNNLIESFPSSSSSLPSNKISIGVRRSNSMKTTKQPHNQNMNENLKHHRRNRDGITSGCANNFKHKAAKVICHRYVQNRGPPEFKIMWKGYSITTFESVAYSLLHARDQLKVYINGLPSRSKRTIFNRVPKLLNALKDDDDDDDN